MRTRNEILNDLLSTLSEHTQGNENDKKGYIEYLHLLDVCVEILENRGDLGEGELETYYPSYEEYLKLNQDNDE